MTVDGRQLASDILAEVKAAITPRVPVVRAITIAPGAATQSYLKIKMQKAEQAGMRMDVVRLPDEATEENIIGVINEPGADAVIVQLPIPERLDLERVLSAIPIEKDADVLSAAAYARFDENAPGALVPPVAAGVWEILSRTGVAVTGKKTAVVGKGQLVGKPCGTLLERNGAIVSYIRRATTPEDRARLFKEADIIISGAGAAHLIKPDMVKDGVVLIDAGTSGSKGGVAGDIDPACAEKASVFTPVPGGVGPVAVSCLFKNTAALVLHWKT